MKTTLLLISSILQYPTLTLANDPLNSAPGQQGFEIHCASCHADSDQRLAPPVFAIKKHYQNEEIDESTFVELITQFVAEPQEQKSKMPGALKRFGLMPKLGLDEAQVRPIAAYIYHNDFTEPAWHQQQHKQQGIKNNFLKQGQQHALAAKAVLGKNLMTAINTKGTDEALQFCNENAIQLTDGVAADSKVSIKRVSDKNRNPNNQANPTELAYIESTKTRLKAGQKIGGQITDLGDKVVGYYPITTNAMCLQCHGKPEQNISTSTAKKIQSLYPEDLATGYDVNELRGIWVIEMPKDQTQ